MGFLNPLLLLAALAVAVPLVLHLFHRHQSQRVVFPALRYLLRTEREHARRIRLRQLLLLLVRCLAVVVLVAAGARLFLRGGGEAHPPTALVLVLDNSLSSSRVMGNVRVLDELKALALASLELATARDRIWVLRAGEPWDVAVPGGPAEARRRVEDTRISGARGDLSAALSRARGLVAASDLPAGEVQLLSDLQASAFDTGPVPGDPVPTVVYAGIPPDSTNRYVRAVTAGGGLAPLAGRRFDAVVELGGTPGDTSSATVRLTLDEQVRGASVLRPGGSAVLPVGPFPLGTVTGYAEADPDALRADDRRYLAFVVRSPPVVAQAGDPGSFVDEALAVLAAGGRLTRGSGSPDVVVSAAGVGLAGGEAPRSVVLPPGDPALLPALNRRLAEAGVPWRYDDAEASGELRVGASEVPVALDGIRVLRRYRLVPEAPEGDEVLVALTDGTPFLVSARGSSGQHLLLATPLDPAATTLPVDAAMVPFLEWAVSGWGSGSSGGSPTTGDPVTLPPDATTLTLPDGTRVPADGSRQFQATRDPGIYTIFQGDSLLAQVALNAPLRESLLAPLTGAALQERLDGAVVIVDTPGQWRRETFISRQGRELWRPLLLVTLLLLMVESWMAATGGRGDARSRRPAPAPVTDDRSAPHA